MIDGLTVGCGEGEGISTTKVPVGLTVGCGEDEQAVEDATEKVPAAHAPVTAARPVVPQ